VGSRSRRVLVIEAEQDVADLLGHHLKDLGCDVDTCRDGKTGIARALDGTAWNLLVLDRNPPDLDGLHICRKVRGSVNYAPILMLGARSNELDLVLGLESGADDYIGKPLSVIEFTARAKAILRRGELLARQPPAHSSLLRIADLEIDLDKRIARRDGRELSLTVKEFDLLAHLMRHPLRVFTRAQLLDQVWGSTCVSFEHTVNSHINRLRAKLEPSPTRPRYIHTVWGVGYRLSPAPSAAQIQGGHA
jgi:DNA-binding response OmpR family regulator